jgi:transposase
MITKRGMREGIHRHHREDRPERGSVQTRMERRKQTTPGRRSEAEKERASGPSVAQGAGDRSRHREAGRDQLGIGTESLRAWVKQADIDAGAKPGMTSVEAARIKELEQENRELKRTNEILRKASAYFAQAELDRR